MYVSTALRVPRCPLPAGRPQEHVASGGRALSASDLASLPPTRQLLAENPGLFAVREQWPGGPLAVSLRLQGLLPFVTDQQVRP